VPVKSRQLLPSNSAAKEWCACDDVLKSNSASSVEQKPNLVGILIGIPQALAVRE
jgi:uncharacterized membrane protein